MFFFDESGGGRGLTLVKEDEAGELGGVTLVKEGEPGELGELGRPGGKLGELEGPGDKLDELGGPGGIGNPAKLSLISFNNFITPSSR